MNFLGNLVWFVFGGFFVFLGYLTGGIVLCLTIIGIPFGIQLFKIGVASLAPFGMQVGERPPGTGCLATLMNILWLLCGGLWVAASHLLFGAILCITIVGIPFGMQHFKLMGLSLTPFGKELR